MIIACIGWLAAIAIGGCESATPPLPSASRPAPSSALATPETPRLTDREVADSVRFRQTFGLRSDEFWIRQVSADPNVNRTDFPVPLSPDEAAELKRRNSLGREAMKQALIEYGASHADEWAGLFTDQAREGIFVVQFTGHVDEHRTALAPILQTGTPVEIRLATRSLVELETMAERLRGTDAWFQTIPANLRGYGIDVVNNQVHVRISSVRPDAATVVAEHFGWTSEVRVESDNTGAYLLANGRVRVLARGGSGRGVPDLACEAHPDIGGGGEDVAPFTNAAGICSLTLPATGAWIFLIKGQALDRQVVAIGRAVVEPGRTSELVIAVP